MSTHRDLEGPISVLVSVTGSAPDLTALHQEIVRQLEGLCVGWELLYLLRGVDADTRDTLRKLQQESPSEVRVLQFVGAASESALLAAGARRARGNLLITLPSRFDADLAVIDALLDGLAEEADLVFAARTDDAPLHSRIFNRLVSWASGSKFTDVASDTRALRRQVVEEIPLYGDFHRYLPVLAERLGFGVREIPAGRHRRARTRRVHRPLLYLWRGIDLLSVFFLSRFTRHPLRLFGAVGSGFAGVGLALLAMLGVQRLLGTALADRPLLVLATLLVGLGVQAFTIGLLGELILFFHARTVRDYRIATVYEDAPSALPVPSAAGWDESDPD